MSYSKLQVSPIAGALGAELSGVQLAQQPAPEVIAEIRRALLEFQVVFLHDQHITPAQFLAFAQSFGEVIDYPFLKGLPEYPQIVPVIKLEHEQVNFGGIWHSDTTYLEIPPMGSMLLALEVPPHGGDTLFASQYLAYETLSPGMKKLLDGMKAISSSAKADVSKTREDRLRDGAREEAKKEYLAEHPVVRTHPETGRKALYVNIAHTLRFAGMTEAESAPLLGFLFQHQVKPEFTCRFRWRAGSLAFWDNRAAQHNPINDYHGYRRVMHRITLKGDRPR
jgi:taurine dioxygenase